MRSSCCVALVVGCIASRAAMAGPAMHFEQHDGTLRITASGSPVATYVWNDPQIRRPYFAHLHTPGGVLVTRNHPPTPGRDPTDHATMHPGLWLAFGDISGVDFWRNKATVKHLRFVEPPAADNDGARFAVMNAYLDGERLVCREICRVRFEEHPNGYLITWDSRFSGPDDFYFGDQEELGLGFRVATPIAVKSGGQIVNDDGLVNEPQVWGKQADWCDYSGKIDGQRVGLLMMPDPSNFRRSWFHARDYGVLVANPFGQNAFTKGPTSKTTVRTGEALRLRYGVLVHEGPIDPRAVYRQWVESIGSVP